MTLLLSLLSSQLVTRRSLPLLRQGISSLRVGGGGGAHGCFFLSTASASAAVEEEEMPKPPPPRRRKKLDPIIVTDRASQRIQELLEGENAKGAIGIRLGVKRRGCNGLSYTLNYAFDNNNSSNKDEQVTTPTGVKVFIEPMALFNVVGTTMDYEETELASEFTFKNPNSKGECGCGESFNV